MSSCPVCGADDSMARCGNCGEWLCLPCFAGHSCLPATGRPILVCPCSGSRLRRSDTQSLTQAALDRTCSGPDRPCFPGCFRATRCSWPWLGAKLDE